MNCNNCGHPDKAHSAKKGPCLFELSWNEICPCGRFIPGEQQNGRECEAVKVIYNLRTNTVTVVFE